VQQPEKAAPHWGSDALAHAGPFSNSLIDKAKKSGMPNAESTAFAPQP